MTSPTCSCGDVSTLARLGLEERPIDPCEIHRPDPNAVRDDMALNSPRIAQSIASALNGAPIDREAQQ